MRIIDNEQAAGDIWLNAVGRAERNPIYDAVAGQPIGSTVALEVGVDIPETDDLNTYRKRLIGALHWRGLKVMTRIDGRILYVKLVSEEARSNGAEH